MSLLIVFLIASALAALDQIIKVWAIANLQGQPDRSFLPIGSFDWMHLHYVENRGAAFSMLSGSRLLLVVFPVIIILLCFYLLLRLGRKHRWLYPSLTLIIAGGLGNLIDRLFRGGAVVDYFDFQPVKFAVFNFADCCVTVGVIIMMIGILFLEKELPEAKKLKEADKLPYARHAAPLPEAGILSDAEILPDADPLPAAELRPEAEKLPDSAALTVPAEEQTDV